MTLTDSDAWLYRRAMNNESAARDRVRSLRFTLRAHHKYGRKLTAKLKEAKQTLAEATAVANDERLRARVKL